MCCNKYIQPGMTVPDELGEGCVRVDGGGGGGADKYFKWIRYQISLDTLKTHFNSLLKRFTITIDGKYKTV